MTPDDVPDEAPDSAFGDELDDRVALLFVACDDALSPSSQMVLAQARDEFRVPGRAEAEDRLPVVLACVAGMFTVAHRTALDPASALDDTGAQSLSIADSLVTTFPDDPEVRGLCAVIRLGLARRPARLDDSGTALPLDEVDRSRWDRRLLGWRRQHTASFPGLCPRVAR